MEEKAEIRDLRCRLCLKISGDRMESFTNHSKYKPIVEDFTGLTIQLGDKLPSMICTGCISVVNILLEFIETCKKSEKILKEEGKLIKCEEIPIKREKIYDYGELSKCFSNNMSVKVKEEICTNNLDCTASSTSRNNFDDKCVEFPKRVRKKVIIKRRRIRKRKSSTSRNNVGLRRFNVPRRFFDGLESRPSESVPSRFDEQDIYVKYSRRRPVEGVPSRFDELNISASNLGRRPVEGVPSRFDELNISASNLGRRPVEGVPSRFDEKDILDNYLRRRAVEGVPSRFDELNISASNLGRRPVEGVPSRFDEQNILDNYLRRRPVESASSQFRESDVLDNYLRRRPVESVPSQIRESDVLDNYLIRRPIESASNHFRESDVLDNYLIRRPIESTSSRFDEQNISSSNLGRRQIENLGSVNIENAQTHIDPGNIIRKQNSRARRRLNRLLRREQSEQSNTPSETAFKCRVISCEKLFTSSRDLRQHIWSNHKGGRREEF